MSFMASSAEGYILLISSRRDVLWKEDRAMKVVWGSGNISDEDDVGGEDYP